MGDQSGYGGWGFGPAPAAGQPVGTAPYGWPYALPPPAWYPDPAGSSGYRWWDGQRWTNAVTPPPRVLAGWWRRVGGSLIDGLILSIPMALVAAALSSFVFDGSGGLALYSRANVASDLGGLVVGVAYAWMMIGWRGQTVGMMAIGVRAVDAETGSPLGSRRALQRAAVAFVLTRLGWGVASLLTPDRHGDEVTLFAVVCLLSVAGALTTYLWPLGSSTNQTLQDKAIGSVVVRTRPQPAYGAPPVAAGPRTRSPALIAAALVMTIGGGILFAIGGDNVVSSELSRFEGAPAIAVPGSRTIELRAGDYSLYQLQVFASGGGATADALDPVNDVTVHGPMRAGPGNSSSATGTSVPVTNSPGIGFANGNIYTAALGFRAPKPGRYTITVLSLQHGTIVLAPSLGTLLGSVSDWLIAFGIGVLLAVAGLVMLVIGLVGRPAGAARRRS